MLALVTLVLGLSSCATGDYTGPDAQIDESTDYVSSKAACKDQGLAWVGGDRGCLSPAEIELWKTSGCGDRGFYKCEALGFPEYWEMPEKREAAIEPPTSWICSYSPTMNRDWHDDVTCTNGVEEQRPYLREWDSFVTQAEIMESAREYEQELNQN